MQQKITCLTVAGSDSCGGAGIQADLKTFAAHHVHGCSVISAITAQNSHGVQHVTVVDAQTIAQQLSSILFDDSIHVGAIKTGMLFDSTSVQVVVAKLQQYLQIHKQVPIIVDPVMVSTSKDALMKQEALQSITTMLFSIATMITPNIPEAHALLAHYAMLMPITNVTEMVQACKQIYTLYKVPYILLKGGHLPESEQDMVDVLYHGKDDSVTTVHSKRITTSNTHGTGCTYASAIASNLAIKLSVPDAVRSAKVYVTACIQQGYAIGSGIQGCLNHFPSSTT